MTFTNVIVRFKTFYIVKLNLVFIFSQMIIKAKQVATTIQREISNKNRNKSQNQGMDILHNKIL